MITKGLKIFITIPILLVLLMAAGWFSIPHWLPKVTGHWLPPGMTVSLKQPEWKNGVLQLADISLQVKDCRLIRVSRLSVSYPYSEIDNSYHWQLNAADISGDINCLNQLPESTQGLAPLSVADILAHIPQGSLSVENLSFHPWQDFAGRLKFNSSSQGQKLSYQGKKVKLSAHIYGKESLVIDQLAIKLPEQEISLNGEMTLPLNMDKLPPHGEVKGKIIAKQYAHPLNIKLGWRGKSGKLIIREEGATLSLAELPWQFNQEQLDITDGKWRWTGAGQPLAGGVNIKIAHWQQGLDNLLISGRINLVTQGERGKANIVLTIKPGRINSLNTQLPFQLTGQINVQDMIMAMSLPAIINGPLVNPKMTFQSGSLFRAWGRLSDEFIVKDARSPLAGTYLTREGFTGRLQAIVNTQHRDWGKFHLHLDGHAENFMPDKGYWRWNYWGNGDLPSLQAKWDIAGKGRWHDTLISVNEMATGFNVIKHGMIRVDTPRLQLTKPLEWQRSEKSPAFNGELRLTAKKTSFQSGGFLPPAELTAKLTGESPNNFIVNGDLSSRNMGPIPFYSRWDGARLRGEARWPTQSLLAFQPLVPKDLGINLRSGDLYAQAAFSVTQGQGFVAGGHWVVKNGSMWLKDGEISGLDFVLPWRLRDSIWQFGVKSPVQLRVKTINNLFVMRNLTADLQGFYPPSEQKPLELTNVNISILDGHINLDKLRLPQQHPAILTLDKLELSRLFTVLKVKQFAMSGKISGKLPLFINNERWIVQQGRIANIDHMTLRLDKDTIDSINKDNISAGAAMDWLRYLEISRLRAQVSLDNLGVLTLNAEIQGVNSLRDKKRQVKLNYHHGENIFHLWRSLRFGNNLEDWLQQNISVLNGSDK
ncbi:MULTISPECIES: YdbH family protein [Photorhabdus]|uniref:YdbH family protein n=1 Tax=Photorhabdus TaxID=29487 RepID=UPI00174C6B44|nr:MULTISPECIES: YdbH family protein [Photorhabdus]MCC8373946.1 YdbH family protein [Photorhabdus bodei]